MKDYMLITKETLADLLSVSAIHHIFATIMH